MTAALVVSLDDPAAADPTVSGAKAAALAVMRGAGLPVPGGFVITAHAHALAVSALAEQIDEQFAALERGASPDAVGAKLRALLAAARVPAELRTAVDAAYRALGGAHVAVRSSATLEDLADASFAGQYESFLGVTSSRQLWRRAREVWASLHAPRALTYRQDRGMPHDGHMAVLVQELVPARAAGVLFTRDPVTGTDERFVVNATYGLGEALVSGEAPADVYALHAQTHVVTERTIVDKPRAARLGRDGRVRAAAVPATRRHTAALSEAELRALGALATRVRSLFGDDRDIEFAIGSDGPQLVQARPITTLEPPVPFAVHWSDPADALRAWSRTTDEPAYRLDADIWERTVDHARRCFARTGAPFTRAHLVRHVNGYRYQAAPDVDERAAVARQRRWRARAERHLDRGTTLYFAEIEPETLRLLEALESARPRRTAPAADWLAHVRRAVAVWGRVLRDLHWRMAAARTADHLPTVYAEVTGEPPIEAAALLQAIDNQTVRLVRRLRGMARLVQSDPAVARAFARHDFARLEQPALRDRPATQALFARRRALLRTYGQRNGHGFGSAAGPLEATWNMEPDRVFELVAAYARADLDTLARHEHAARRERVRALRRARRLAARERELAERFERALRSATAAVRSMEGHNHLMEQRTWGLLREGVHGLGRALVRERRLVEPDDVYHLTLSELRSAVRRGSGARRDWRALVRQRVAERAERARMAAPDRLGSGPPAPFMMPRDLFEGAGPAGLHGDELHGVPASRGRHRGRARVVRARTGRPPDVRRGDILVAENAGPDWTPVFALLGGLVLDAGAAFQHAALVAREYGIPAVVMTRDATRVINDGDRITIDGTRGVVELAARVT